MFTFNINGQPFPFPPGFQQPPQQSPQPPPAKRFEGANVEDGEFEDVMKEEDDKIHT